MAIQLLFYFAFSFLVERAVNFRRLRLVVRIRFSNIACCANGIYGFFCRSRDAFLADEIVVVKH